MVSVWAHCGGGSVTLCMGKGKVGEGKGVRVRIGRKGRMEKGRVG